MKAYNFRQAVIMLFLVGSFVSCSLSEPNTTVYDEEISPCDPLYNVPPYPHHPIYVFNILPWVDEVISEWLENGIYGRIWYCNYKYGIGYLFEPLENSTDSVYSFRSCDGTVLYEGEGKPIEDTYPELNIEKKWFLLEKYPSWEQVENSDEFICYAINPFTLPRVKEMIYRCKHRICRKTVSFRTYKDGVGFLLAEHENRTAQTNYEFLDCSGNLLGKVEGVGSPYSIRPDLNIDFNRKIILDLRISLNVY